MKFQNDNLGNYIQEHKEKNKDLLETNLLGVTISKNFIPSIANTNGTNFKNYKLISYNNFVYGPVTSRNGDKISISLFKNDSAIVSQSYKIFSIIDEKLLNPDFLMLWFEREEFDRYARFHSHGSTREVFTWKKLCETKIPVPPIEIQDKIVQINEIILNRIQLKEKINNNLLEQCKLIYKSWFRNFDPFKNGNFIPSEFGNIPEGWSIGKLGDIIDIFDSKRIPLSNQEREPMDNIYPYYGASSLMDYVDDYIFDGIYLLIGEDGTVIDSDNHPILQYVWDKFWVNNHAHIVQGKNGFSTEAIYILLSKTNIQQSVTGAVQAKINQTNLKKIPVIIPSEEVLNQYNDILKSYFNLFRKNSEEIKKLTKLRDILLPKLMSGEIDVSNINFDL